MRGKMTNAVPGCHQGNRIMPLLANSFDTSIRNSHSAGTSAVAGATYNTPRTTKPMIAPIKMLMGMATDKAMAIGMV